MPLKKSKSKKDLAYNISELMSSYSKGGRFAKGKSRSKARKMAIAAAFDVKRRSSR